MLVGLGLESPGLECVNDDMKKLGFKREMAHDKDRVTAVGYSWYTSASLKASMENLT